VTSRPRQEHRRAAGLGLLDPRRLTGKKREHFEKQLRKLREVNALGGVAFWVEDVRDFITIIKHVLAGGRVEEPETGGPPVLLPRAGGHA
jgi:hypothetical protein